MGIQLDFGGFDPAFIGVTLRLMNARAWKFHNEHRASDTPLPVAHLPPDERFEALSIASVLMHELRHFHDFFLSAYSARVFKLRLQSLANVMQILPYLFADEANCLPLPLPKWCRMDPTTRAKYLNRLPGRADRQPWIPVALPQIHNSDPPLQKGPVVLDANEALAQLIRAALSNHEWINEFAAGAFSQREKLHFQPWQILELSALIVQMQELWTTYGEAEVNHFILSVLAAEKSPYAAMLRVVMYMEKQLGLPLQVASAVASWSLFGSYTKDKWNACPTARFSALWSHLQTRGFEGSPEDIPDLFARWSHDLKLSTVEEGVRDAQGIYARAHDLLQSQFKASGSNLLDELGGTLFCRVAEGVARASAHMVRQFLADPGAYTHPLCYLQDPSLYVCPVLRLMCDDSLGWISPVPIAELEREGCRVIWASAVEGKEVIHAMIEPLPLSKFVYLDVADVDEFATQIALTDYFFSETVRDSLDVKLAGRIYFSNHPSRPFEV